MVNRLCIAVAASILVATSLWGAEPVTPAADAHHVLSVAASTSSTNVEYRYMFHDSRLAIIAILGHSELSSNSTGAVTYESKQRVTDLGAGLRRNFLSGEQLRPFLQIDVLRDSHGNDCGGMYLSPYWAYSASGGAEYFLAKRLSIEGRAGVQYARSSSRCSAGGEELSIYERDVGTFHSVLAINFYF